jgi:TMEM175 potassium channel family protein
MTDRDDEMVLRVARMEAFSDGVFAIAITLLVLEISIPPGSEGHLLNAVLNQWPSYLAYIVSFATIGATWLATTRPRITCTAPTPLFSG